METSEFVDRLLNMKGEVSDAIHKADMATAQIATHEAVCAERYGNLQRQMDGMALSLPNFNTELGKIKNIVYIGVGLWVGLPVITGFLYGLWTVIKGTGHVG